MIVLAGLSHEFSSEPIPRNGGAIALRGARSGSQLETHCRAREPGLDERCRSRMVNSRLAVDRFDQQTTERRSEMPQDPRDLLSHLRPAGLLARAEKEKLVFVAPQKGGSKSIDEDYSSTCRPSWSPAAVVVGRFRRRVRPFDYGPIWIGRIGCREQDRASGLRQFPHMPELLNGGGRRKLGRPESGDEISTADSRGLLQCLQYRIDHRESASVT